MWWNIRYTKDEIQEFLSKYKAVLIEYINSKNIIIKDTKGYKYRATKSNLERSNKLPHKFRGKSVCYWEY